MHRIIDSATGEPLPYRMTDELAADLDKDCIHPRDEWARFLINGGSVQVRRWCPDCGDMLSGARRQQPDDWRLPAVDQAMRKRVTDERERQRAALYLDHARRQREAYDAYMASPEWAAKRQQVLDREDGRCEGCGGVASEVHHLTYDHFGNEFLFELMALCRPCHDRWHERLRQ